MSTANVAAAASDAGHTVPSPQQPNDVRLRRVLDADVQTMHFPQGYHFSTFDDDEDATDVHRLLVGVFDDEESDFTRWHGQRSCDSGYDPELVFLVRNGAGRLAGLCWCWDSNFVKDLAVAETARGKGIGKALMLWAFDAMRRRGATHCDLKTNTVHNAAAYQLYRKLGMVEVDWEGSQ